MKKRKLKNYLKLGILFFGISLLLWNCEKEDDFIETIQQANLERQINYLTAKELKIDLLSTIQSRTGFNTTNNYQNKNSNYQNSLDLENIMQVIDTIGNTNYTFRLKVNDNDEGTFYNLILNENSSNNEPLIYVNKYVVDQNHKDEFITSGYDFRKFTGKAFTYNINNFLAAHSSYLNRGGSIDNCPCEEDNIIDGNNPIGSPNGSGGSGVSSGVGSNVTSTTVCTTTYTTYSNPCDGANSGNSADIWDEAHNGEDYTASNGQHCSGTTGPVTIATSECRTYYNFSKSTSKKADDCNNPCAGTGTGGDSGVLLPLNQFETIEDHCPDLKNIIDANKSNAKPFLQNLKTTVDQSGENGFSMKKDGDTYTTSDLPPTTKTEIGIPIRGSNYAGAHSHPSREAYPMFSWGDIHTLLKLYRFSQSNVKNEVTFMLASKNNPLSAQVNVFALKINNFGAFRTAFYKALSDIVNEKVELNTTDSIEKKLEFLNKKLAKKYRRAGENQQEKAFLENFKDFNLSLYKANDNIDNWSEVKTAELTPTASGVIEIPCQ